ARSAVSVRTAPRPAAEARPRSAAALWAFTRPHTIIGTTLGVLGLYAIATAELPGVAMSDGLPDLGWTLLAAWCVNVYIVGLNQLEDVEIDRINKPFLPLASGALDAAAARRIVAACAVVPVVLAVTQGAVELAGVLTGLAVGTAYSVPPLRLKRFPLAAALSITGVRAVVVNLAVALHFTESLGDGSRTVPAAVWALCLFVVPFAFAISILKDVPDAEGDRRFRIATFTLRLGPRRVMGIAMGALSAGYLGMAAAGPLLVPDAQPVVLVAGHLAALALLWRARLAADPEDPAAATRFYMRVWALFFLEYLIVPAAALLG
ncbi:MAG TPA: homogentisate phytyltransferase, partial [Solirubrobacteraceae bacterium]|nr:homogentisate phytyltransferase [Solirubrobacteraceae bacterium]